MNRMKDKVVIVTGGSLGIGRETCLLLADEGATVVVTDVLDDEGKSVADKISLGGGKAAFWHMDVANGAEVNQTFADIQQRFQKIDVLVNNAGIAGVNKPTHEGSALT